jgi:hypothetical protein
MRICIVILAFSACGRRRSKLRHRARPSLPCSGAASRPRRRTPAAAASSRPPTGTQGLKILVSTEDRWLWLVAGRDTLLSTQVAIGMRSGFEFEGRKLLLRDAAQRAPRAGEGAEPALERAGVALHGARAGDATSSSCA